VGSDSGTGFFRIFVFPIRELDAIHNLIDWLRLEQLLSGIHAKRRGEKAWPPLMMPKALLLQSWYKPSVRPWKNNWSVICLDLGRKRTFDLNNPQRIGAQFQ